jgi:hypothetical protein
MMVEARAFSCRLQRRTAHSPSRLELLERLAIEFVGPGGVCPQPQDALIVLADGEQSDVLVAVFDQLTGDVLPVVPPNSLGIRVLASQ